ncbi:unnamed protein product [Oppiella nova]|uniref:Uncharacterized protein n=1 Tax=Oppiella nova TaxID=334625 RepID=A0A7R9QP80_9ACAR|nr:unnamed protein product [Oppiella nova]CAG2169954.1 unnamed protein product [Oppiella nova]
MSSRGSKKAVEIAQKNIPDALARLDKYIEDAESLDSVAINEFGEQSQQIFEIIGPEAAKFAEQKDQLEAKINKKYKEQDELYRELGIVQVNSAYYLMSASEKYLSGVQCDLDATKQRLNELNKMNMDVETTMKNIPQTRQKTITTHNTVGWWFYNFTTTKTSTVTLWLCCNTTRAATSHPLGELTINRPLKKQSSQGSQEDNEKNPNREADLKYYNSLVAARKERINNNLADRNNREERTRIINADLARYKNDYQAATTELQGLQKNFNLQMNEINEEIEKLRADKKNLDKLEYAVVQKIGLQGIKSMVKTNIDLLSSDRDEDIYLAGSLLIKQVEFLSNYTLQAQKTMQPSIEYDMDELTGKMKNNAITDE